MGAHDQRLLGVVRLPVPLPVDSRQHLRPDRSELQFAEPRRRVRHHDNSRAVLAVLHHDHDDARSPDDHDHDGESVRDRLRVEVEHNGGRRVVCDPQ